MSSNVFPFPLISHHLDATYNCQGPVDFIGNIIAVDTLVMQGGKASAATVLTQSFYPTIFCLQHHKG